MQLLVKKRGAWERFRRLTIPGGIRGMDCRVRSEMVGQYGFQEVMTRFTPTFGANRRNNVLASSRC